jgi:hypothetical protein
MQKRPDNLKEDELCPKCGTIDCTSLEYSNKQITVTGAGILGKTADVYLQCCVGRQQLNKVKELVDASR